MRAVAKMPAATRRRVSSQNATILDGLRSGDMTNRQLAAIALKYSSRISELRQAGYKIVNYGLNRVTGLSYYRLVEAQAA